jgi:hypothetical protein
MALKSNQVHQLLPSPWQDDNSFKESVGQQFHQYQQKKPNHISPHTQARPWHGIENQVFAQNRHTNVEGVKTVTVIPSFDNMISNSNTDVNTINDFDF